MKGLKVKNTLQGNYLEIIYAMWSELNITGEYSSNGLTLERVKSNVLDERFPGITEVLLHSIMKKGCTQDLLFNTFDNLFTKKVSS